MMLFIYLTLLIQIKAPHSNFPRCINNKIYFPDGSKGGPCYENGAVSTEVPQCSAFGVQILKEGGNAVDAAIASCICVGIINSFSSGIGGGGFLLIKTEKNNQEIIDTLDFRETAPYKSKTSQYQGKGDLTKKGGLAVGVPGEVKGLYEAHKKYGKLPWKKLFDKNIEIAKGFVVSKQLYKRLVKLKACIFEDPGLKEIYTKNNELVNPKDIIKRENYARTLKILSENPEDFYCGDIANNIIESVKKHGGVMEKKDLKDYKAIFREAISGDFKDYKVYTTPLPTSGLFIIEALNILENFDLDDLKKQGEEAEKLEEEEESFFNRSLNEKNNSEKDFKTSKIYPHYHLLVEIYKFMTAKRGLMADPEYMRNHRKLIEDITSKKTAEIIAKKIDLNKTLPEEEYGFTGETVDDHGTTHLNVVDKDGTFVLITSTVNLEFGAKFMDQKTGIIFNDEIDDFYVENNKNAFDLACMKSNTIEPGKRPFSSAAPFLLVKHDEIIALGAAGGTRIPTSLIGIIFHLILGKNLSEAIAELRIHNQFHPDKTYIEKGMKQELLDYLNKVGHKTEESALNGIFTSVQGIHMIMNKNKRIIEAVSDKRKGGVAHGY